MKALFSLLFLVAFSGSSVAQLDFKPAVNTEGWDRPLDIAVGDFDGDGKDDFAVGASPRTGILVHYSNGNNDFTKLKLAATSGFAGILTIEAGDFNNDGKDDLLVYEDLAIVPTLSRLAVWISNGRDFTKKTVDMPVQATWRFGLYDMDSDGKLDIVQVDRGQPLRYFKNDGTGNFSAVAVPDLIIGTVTSPVSYLRFQVTDVNNDQRLDIVTINTDVVTTYLKNAGSGYTKMEKSFTGDPQALIAADFSHDGLPDLVAVTTQTVNNVFTFFLKYFVNNGQGNFEAPVDITTRSGWSGALTHFDYNNDGLEDILAGSNFPGDATGLFLNVGNNNGFQDNSPDWDSQSIMGVGVANLDGVGASEIVTTSFSGVIDIYKYDGQDYFHSFEIFVSAGCTTGKIYDLDNDGKMDLVGNSTHTLPVWYGKGNFEFEDPVFHQTFTQFFYEMAVADFNSDGYGDIVYADMIFLSTGPRTYSRVLLDATSFAVVVGDLNNDGKVDIATNKGSHLSDGTGNFTLKEYSYFTAAGSIALVRYNDDNFDDLAIASERKLYISLNDGSGFFETPSEIPLTAGIGHYIRAVDFNNDGFKDLIASVNSASNGTLTLLRRDATSHFIETRLPHTTNTSSGTADVMDMNNDGIRDVVANLGANANTGITVYLGKSDGGYESALNFKSTNASNQQYISGGNSIDVADMNNDGLLDVAIFSLNGAAASVLPNELVKEPTTPPASLAISNLTFTTATASFQKGNGNGRIVLVRRNANETAVPVDNTAYSVNPAFTGGGIVGVDSRTVMRSNETSVTITSLFPGNSYVISVFEYQANSENTIINYNPTPVTTTFTTVDDPTVAVNDEWTNSFTLYPNPVTSTAWISFPQDFTMSEEPVIFNAVGSALRLKKTNVDKGIEINTDELAPGLYFVRLQGQKPVVLKMFKR